MHLLKVVSYFMIHTIYKILLLFQNHLNYLNPILFGRGGEGAKMPYPSIFLNIFKTI